VTPCEIGIIVYATVLTAFSLLKFIGTIAVIVICMAFCQAAWPYLWRK